MRFRKVLTRRTGEVEVRGYCIDDTASCTSGAVDACVHIDESGCVVEAYDYCEYDHKSCSYGASDECGSDWAGCSGYGYTDSCELDQESSCTPIDNDICDIDS